MTIDDVLAINDVARLNRLNRGMVLADKARIDSLCDGDCGDDWHGWMQVYTACLYERATLRIRVAQTVAPWFEVTQ